MEKIELKKDKLSFLSEYSGKSTRSVYRWAIKEYLETVFDIESLDDLETAAAEYFGDGMDHQGYIKRFFTKKVET